jgi:hypothetical protein
VGRSSKWTVRLLSSAASDVLLGLSLDESSGGTSPVVVGSCPVAMALSNVVSMF